MASLFVPLAIALLLVGGAVVAAVALRVRDQLDARARDDAGDGKWDVPARAEDDRVSPRA